ncbi:MAG: diaminopimelate epimerase [Saprospiraceae bacterium]
MTIPFSKYQGTGNDFVIIDNRKNLLSKNDYKFIEQLCDRRFGIGADGLILLQEKEGFDFDMVYFNSDGKESSMCGNGGRCIVAFAKKLGLIKDQCSFDAIDGRHEARIQENDKVELKMSNVKSYELDEDAYILDTGSPHYVVFVEDVDDINVVENGQAIRYSERFREKGINVNFVEKTKSELIVATYERGVEAETYSCGTGVTASAIAYALKRKATDKSNIKIQTKGGQLEVHLTPSDQGFNDIWLCGPATLVFEGQVNRPKKQ